MEFKKKIDGKNLRVHISPWTSKITIEYNDETIHESWELAILVTLMELLMFSIGVLFGIFFGFILTL